MLDVVILEAAQHVDDCIDLADVAEELVAEPFALARPFHKAGDVDKAQLGFDDLGALGDCGDLLETLVGDGDLADIGLDRAEGIVRRLRRLRLGERIEQGGLADVRQADDPATETHDDCLLAIVRKGWGWKALALSAGSPP